MLKELANIFCWFRIIVGVSLLFLPMHPAVAVLYSLALLSDLADGYCARKFGVNAHAIDHLLQRFQFKSLDPIADFIIAIGGLAYFCRANTVAGAIVIGVVILATLIWQIAIRRAKSQTSSAYLSTSFMYLWFAIEILALFLVWKTSGSPYWSASAYFVMVIFYAIYSQIADETRLTMGGMSSGTIRHIKTSSNNHAYYIIPGMASAPYEDFQIFAEELNGDVFVLHNYCHWSPKAATRVIEAHAKSLGKNATMICFSLGSHTYFDSQKFDVILVAPCIRDTLSIGPKWLRWLCGLIIRLAQLLLWPIILFAWFKLHGEWRNAGWYLDQLSDVLMNNHWNQNPMGIILFKKDEFLRNKGNAFIIQYCTTHNIPNIVIDTSFNDEGETVSDKVFCHCNLAVFGKQLAQAVKNLHQKRAEL